jgi:hypothetical protein
MKSYQFLSRFQADKHQVVEEGGAMNAGHLPDPRATAQQHVLQQQAQTLVPREDQLPETALRLFQGHGHAAMPGRGAEPVLEEGLLEQVVGL